MFLSFHDNKKEQLFPKIYLPSGKIKIKRWVTAGV